MSFIKLNNQDFYYDTKLVDELCELNCCNHLHSSGENPCDTDMDHVCFCWMDDPENYCRLSLDFLSKYLPSNSRVLELDGNLGVTACHINKILDNPSLHVVTESQPIYKRILEKNKILHKCDFSILEKEIEDINIEDDIDIDFNFIFSDSDGPELKFLFNNMDYIKEHVDYIILNTYHYSYSRGGQPNDPTEITRTHCKIISHFVPQIDPKSVHNLPIQVFINKKLNPTHYPLF